MKLSTGLLVPDKITHLSELASSQIINIEYSVKKMVMEGHAGNSKTNINVLSPKLGVRNMGTLLLISSWYNCIHTYTLITHIYNIYIFKNTNSWHQIYDIEGIEVKWKLKKWKWSRLFCINNEQELWRTKASYSSLLGNCHCRTWLR